MTSSPVQPTRLGVARRSGDVVSPLELFFDLVFVLAITQCSALMAHDPTWRGLAEGLVVLGLLWWSWVGYAWLTSVVDPDDGAVRLMLFAAMAALLVCSLGVPGAFEDLGLTFAIAYAVVRVAHIALFVLASREDPGLRHSVMGLAASTAGAAAVLIAGAAVHGDARLAIWAGALAFDMVAPLVIDTSGWRLVPAHFAERHGLIVIVALGESIVAIGVGAEGGIDAGVIVAAVLGVAVSGALWWMYFDTAAPAAAQRLAEIDDVQTRNELARDAFSYLHLPMVAGIVLLALGVKTALEDVSHSLSWEAAAALLGGPAIYVLAHVAFKRRVLATLGVQRLVAAAALVAFVPIAHRIAPIAALAVVAIVLWSLLLYEAIRFADTRRAVRNGMVRTP